MIRRNGQTFGSTLAREVGVEPKASAKPKTARKSTPAPKAKVETESADDKSAEIEKGGDE